MGTELITYKTNQVAGLIDAAVANFRKALPQSSIKVLGEVLAVRTRPEFMELTLIDSGDGATSITARLPLSPSQPRLGYVIGVTGHLGVFGNGSASEVFLDGSTFDESTGPGRNHLARQACLKKALTETKTARLCEPSLPFRKLVIVAGRDTKAEADFRGRLWPKVSSSQVDTIQVHLRDAGDIARGIRLAAEDVDVDAIVVVRGGGTPFDLHRFDQPEVLEAIAEAVSNGIFVLVAVGHAQDKPLANEIASHSETTPTAAATYLNKLLYREEAEESARDLASSIDDAPPATSRRSQSRKGLLGRAADRGGRWRRTIIFGVGVLAGAVIVPILPIHSRVKPANPLSTLPGTMSPMGATSSHGRDPEARAGSSRHSKGEPVRAEASSDDGARPSRR
jgi:hypothetical protein